MRQPPREAVNLPVGAGAGLRNLASAHDVRLTAKSMGVFGDEGQQLINQLAERHEQTLAEIEQTAINAVTLGPPAVFLQ